MVCLGVKPYVLLIFFWKRDGEIASVLQVPTIIVLISLVRRRSEFRQGQTSYQCTPAVLQGQHGSAEGFSAGRALIAPDPLFHWRRDPVDVYRSISLDYSEIKIDISFLHAE